MNGTESKFTIKSIGSDLLQGSLLGTITALYGIVLAFLIFSHYPSHIAQGIRTVVFSSLISSLIIGLLSKEKYIFAETMSIPCLIIASIGASLASSTFFEGLNVDPFYYYIGIMSTSCLLSGILLFMMSHYNLGNIIRFTPYSVTASFLLSLLILMFNYLFTLVGIDFTTMFTNFNFQSFKISCYSLIPGLALGFYLLSLEKKQVASYIDLIILILCGLLFYLLIYFLDITVFESKYTWGLLFPYDISDLSFKASGIFKLLDNSKNLSENFYQMFGTFDLHLFTSYLPNIVFMFFATTFGSMLSLNSLELELNKEIDVNKELSNVAKSYFLLPILGGGILGYHNIVATHVAIVNKVKSTFVSILGLSIPCIIALISPQLYLFIPKFIIFGILLKLLLNMTIAIIIVPLKISKRIDKITTIIGALLILYFGLVIGIIIVTFIVLIEFSVIYIKCRSVRAEYTTSSLRSTHDRDMFSEKIFETNGQRNVIWLLQGFLFFGNSYNIKNRLSKTIAKAKENNKPIQSIILDFKAVQGIDASFIFNTLSICEMLNRNNITLSITGTDLNKNLLPDNVTFFNYLDESLSCHENILLESFNIIENNGFDQLSKIFPHKNDRDILQKFYEYNIYHANNMIYSQKSAVFSLYLLMYGSISLFSTDNFSNKSIIAKTVKAGSFVGEGEIFIDSIAKSTALTKTKCLVLNFSHENLYKLEKEHPDLSIILYRYILATSHSKLYRSELVANEILGYTTSAY